MKRKHLLIILILFLAFCGRARAATISPAIADLSGDPGETVEEIITIFNETEEDIYLEGQVEIFRPQGEEGEVKVLPPVENDLAVTWVELPINSIALSPGEKINLPLAINIPQTAEVGGYYLAIVWQSSRNPWTGENQINSSIRLANLVLLRVNGKTEEDMEIIDFSINRDLSVPVFESKLRNKSNVHFRPQGTIVVKSFLGVSGVSKFNKQETYVLPASDKIFKDVWAGYTSIGQGGWLENFKAEVSHFPWGRMSARLDLEYGSGKRLSSDEVYFWVIPWRIISLVFVIFVVWVLIKIIRRKK